MWFWVPTLLDKIQTRWTHDRDARIRRRVRRREWKALYGVRRFNMFQRRRLSRNACGSWYHMAYPSFIYLFVLDSYRLLINPIWYFPQLIPTGAIKTTPINNILNLIPRPLTKRKPSFWLASRRSRQQREVIPRRRAYYMPPVGPGITLLTSFSRRWLYETGISVF